MVEQVARDLRALGRNIAATIATGRADVAKMGEWADIVRYCAERLESSRCPECGGPMIYDPELDAHVCHHPESDDSRG